MERDQPVLMSALFANYKMPARIRKPNERSELVRYFFENAKEDWQGKRPLTAAYIASRLSHLGSFDLYAFRSQCEDRKRKGYPFGKYFWGSLKVS